MSAYNMHVHFIEKSTGKMISQLWVWQVPAVGEECRFSGKAGPRYFKVVQVVHVYDEDVNHHRANVGLELI